MPRKSRFLLLILIAILCISISILRIEDTIGISNIEIVDMQIVADHPFGYQDVLRDYYPTDEWRSCTPEEQGMNSSLLGEMVPYIEENEWAIDSIIIIRGGYIVFEEYLNPEYPMNYYRRLQSVTKSFTSALVGLAIKEGFLAGVEETIVDLFSDRTISNYDERKNRMTVEHLLTMTSGIEWDEWSYPYTDVVNNNMAALSASNDGVDYFLNLPMVAEPGEVWNYNGGNAVVLGALIEKLSNMTLLDFAETYLFDPIGISGGGWEKMPCGYYEAGGALWLKPRDMARFGYLYLNGGMWNESEVIPLDWILNSTDYYTISPRYGYMWWLETGMDAYVASGLFGQKIMVCPEDDLVVTFTASITGIFYDPHYELYYDYIRASIIGPPRSVTTTTTNTSTYSTIEPPPTFEHGLFAIYGVYLVMGIFGVVVLAVIYQIRYRKVA
ncbi:class C beta-lactamase-related serine hydrolase [Candidatus Thorarchaeota archaeon]|nr:MAG: class C beta-lactamase-related serine hydrolase [Candidatus Thorarchaeota archaeon]